MSSNLARLQGILSNADSKKVADRKKCVQELLDLYDDEEVVKTICNRSRENPRGSESWSRILQIVNDLLMEEAVRHGTKESNRMIVERQNTCSVLWKTVQNAHRGGTPLLECSDLVPVTIQILKQKSYEKYYDTYLSVLITYVLAFRVYIVDISHGQWIQLLKLAINLFKTGPSYVNKRTILEAVKMIIEHGCAHKNLIADVKQMLPFLEDIFLDAKRHPETLLEPAYAIMNTVSRQIATECRIALCQFSEKVSPDVIVLDSNEEKYKLLLLFVKVHHPKGVSTTHAGACAHNLETWNALVKSIYLMILRDCKADRLSKTFVNLAAEVLKQILDNPGCSLKETPDDEYDDVKPLKRRRVSKGVQRLTDTISGHQPEEAWPMIQILTVLLERYPECLKFQDFTPFLQTVVELLAHSGKKESVTDSLYNLCAVLMKNERLYSVIDTECSNVHWNKVWDCLLRSLNMNQNEVSGHELVQAFLMHNKIFDTNALLKMYLKNVISWSVTSVRTLRLLCERLPLPVDITVLNINLHTTSNTNSVRLYLLEWILNIPWRRIATRIPVDELCSLIIGTTLKSRYQNKMKFTEPDMNVTCNCIRRGVPDLFRANSFEDVERCYLLLTYNANFFVPEEKGDVKTDTQTSDNVLHIEELLDYAIEKFRLCTEKNGDDVCTVLIRIAIMGKIVSMLKRLNVLSGDLHEFPLVASMKKHLKHASALLEKIDSSTIKYLHLFNVIKALNTLYETAYDTEVARIIVSCSTPGTLKNLFSLMNVKDGKITDYNASTDYEDVYSTFESRRKRVDKRDVNRGRCNYCFNSIIRTQATKVLTLFCCMDVGEEKCEIQATLMRNLLTLDMYDLKDTANLHMALTVLELLPRYKAEELHRNHSGEPIEVLLELLKQCYKDEMVLRRILNVLPYMLEYALRNDLEVKRLTKVLAEFSNYLNDETIEHRIQNEYIKCLSKVPQIDPSFSESTSHFNNVEHGSIVEKILPYFHHSLYVVRLQAVRCVKHIYPMKNVDPRWKEDFFRRMEESVKRLHASGERECDSDERETRIASTLHLFATVIYTSGMLQCQALLSMLMLSAECRVEVHTIRKALDTIEGRIVYKDFLRQNMTYLLLHWYNSKRSLKEFPWTLTECESQQQFCQTYLDELVLLLMQNFDTTSALSLCKYAGQEFERVVENIFPRIVPWLLYSDVERHEEQARRMLDKLRSNRDEFATVKRYPTLFKETFEQILTYVIQRLHDQEDFERTFNCRVSFSKTDPPHFRRNAVDMCLEYIQANFLKGQPMPRVLATNYTSVLQKILLRLISNLYETSFLEQKLKCFHQYAYFCSTIIRDMQHECYDSLSTYIVREIGYSLLHLIKLGQDVISELAGKFFHTFVQTLFPRRSEQMKAILNFTVMILIPIALNESEPSIALNTLEFLIIDQKTLLYDAIEKLNAFPDLPVFRSIRNVHNALKYKTAESYNLQSEIRYFLDTVHGKNVNCSVEDISQLRLQLSNRKKELREIYGKLEMVHDSAEDCASSMLHQLVHRLIKLTESGDIQISTEAAKCLGELGPIDLRTMILHTGISHTNETSDFLGLLSYEIVAFLSEFLIQSDIKLRAASSDALYTVFRTAWGLKLASSKYTNGLKDVLGDSQTPMRLEYVRPFISVQRPKAGGLVIDADRTRMILTANNEIWTIKSENGYADWIVEATCTVATCFTGLYFERLVPVCKLSTDFCELLLPRIIFLAIYLEEDSTGAICSCIDRFFDHHFSPSRQRPGLKATGCDHQTVHCMLNVVNYVRVQTVDNVSLQLNYMCIAKAAQYCSAFCTAIQYAELACENMVADQNEFSNIPKIDCMYEHRPAQGKIVQEILMDAYLKIGDPDAIYGTGSSHLDDYSSRVRHYNQTKKWDEVMVAMDVDMSSGNSSAFKEMANSLHQSGLQYSLNRFVSAMQTAGERVDDEILCENAWRLGNWNLCESSNALRSQLDSDARCSVTENDYAFNHYQALKFFHESNETGVRNATENARRSVVKALKNISLESSKTIYEKLMQLQLIREIEELNAARPENCGDVLRKWREQDTTSLNEFQYIEPILTQRTVMYQNNKIVGDNAFVKDALARTYLEIANIAVDQDHLPIASRALAVLAKLPDLAGKIQDQQLYQESLLAKRRKDLQIGRFLMRRLIQKPSLDQTLRADVLRVYGDWMAETKSENPQAVIEKYYLESIRISESCETRSESLNEAQVALARFADAQYAEIRKYLNSPQFEAFKESINRAQKDIDIDPGTRDRDILKAVIINKRQNTNDAAQLEHIQREMKYYLKLALENYIRTLQKCDNHDLLIFRVVALWLDNNDDEEINELMKNTLDAIPSYKFIPVISQIGSRMSANVNNVFIAQISRIMDRCARKHPYHTLPVLLGLKNLYDDYKYSNTVEPGNIKEESRVLAAKLLTDQLRRSGIADIVQQMDRLSHAIVMFAYYSTPHYKPGSYKIPANQELLRIKNLNQAIVPTLTIPVRPNGNYDNVVGVAKYAPAYETVGGVNVPKKVTCIGTDGISRSQLIKGKDDLRQDAIMQQVFSTINILLKTCKETRRRKLSFRTYKVVPLTQRSGVIEWCNNTCPISSVLLGSVSNAGLHKKLYPGDYSADFCKEIIKGAQNKSKPEKLQAFKECAAHMHPVLHHFFIKKFPSPQAWYERRLAFTRSIATTSMAGYVLGLGDRHLSNILLDQTTAEVVHIDFGIAFEQGKLLPIPETVPFRLTRNIEAAMGVSGVEGTMRRCCEETLTVLRNQKQIIITLLQVLLYDPLFTWAITPDKARTLQNDKSAASSSANRGMAEINKLAERALLRVEQKLQGIEDGVASSVPGQVERLLQQARDPLNLCQLFCGWQPYL